MRAMRVVLLAVLVLALAAPPALAQSAPLQGPDGTSLEKVLVIGTDGTRWDRLRAAMRAGRAPNLARLARQGFGLSSRLEYGPGTNTISEVGWSSVASGVWPAKHGVDGSEANRDPLQATKNGFLDFLTRAEAGRSDLSTFIASDWDNLGLAQNGGPIFGTAMDANFAARVSEETLAAWDAGDEQVTRATARYLRRGNPDVGFAYLGVVDETAHLAGSATSAYDRAIARTDRRIGRLLAAIRARPAYPFESWTFLVTTDHGQRPLTEPSVISHFFDSRLERTVFVFGAGSGLRGVRQARIVDVLPTVLRQAGVTVDPAWGLDGRPLQGRRRFTASTAEATVRDGRVAVTVSLGARPRGVRAVSFRLPARAGTATVGSNGRRIRGVRAGRRTVTARLNGRALRTLALTATVTGAKAGDRVTVTLRGRRGALGTLAVPLQAG
jgi:hypothetical protein